MTTVTEDIIETNYPTRESPKLSREEMSSHSSTHSTHSTTITSWKPTQSLNFLAGCVLAGA